MDRTRIVAYVRLYGWLVVAAICWGIGYNLFTTSTDSSTGMFYSGIICLLPVGVRMIRALISASRRAGDAGSNVYDASYTGYGFRITNRRFSYTVITFIVVGVLMIAFGLFILPVFFIINLINAIRFTVNDIRLHR